MNAWRRFRFVTLLLPLGVFLTAACATDNTDWIKVGVTTKDEVVAQYGEPDLVIISPQGEALTYRAFPVQNPVGPIEVARAGPFGLGIFQTEFVVPGLGVRPVAAGPRPRPAGSIAVVLDEEGIVREVQHQPRSHFKER
jgi:hypothetical protein